jgi:hypothetical protein
MRTTDKYLGRNRVSIRSDFAPGAAADLPVVDRHGHKWPRSSARAGLAKIGLRPTCSVPQNSPSSYIKISAFLTTLASGLSMFRICAEVIGRRSTPARPELRQSQGICR